MRFIFDSRFRISWNRAVFFFCFFLTPTFLKTKRSTAVPGSNKLLNGIEYKCIPVACLMLIFWLQQVFSISGWREFLAAVVSSKFSLDALFIGNGHDDDGIGRLGSSCSRRQLFFYFDRWTRNCWPPGHLPEFYFSYSFS